MSDTFAFTYVWRGKTYEVVAAGANDMCAEVEALGMLWEVTGDDRVLDEAKCISREEVK